MSEFEPVRSVRQQRPPKEESIQIEKEESPTLQMARRLSDAYLREQRWRETRLRGSSNIPLSASVINPIWQTIARELIRKGCYNPERFIHAQCLRSIAKDGTLSWVPYSQAFNTQTAYTYSGNYDAHADAYQQQQLKSDLLQFQVALGEAERAYSGKTPRELWNFVLMNKMYEMSPLFKYCLATSENMREVMEEFHADALQQFLSDPIGYKQNWSALTHGVIPKSLIAEVENILQAAI